MYSVINTTFVVVSTLTYEVQWDTTLQWWEDTKAVSSLTNSTAYGNYYDTEIASKAELNEGANYSDDYGATYSTTIPENFTKVAEEDVYIILTTGALKVTKVKNIYDMAGNLREWTMEGYSSYYRVYRGGYFDNSGTSDGDPVFKRNISYPSNTGSSYIDFRPSLCIKK